ncbi:hypothetical protein RUM44_010462 [Polyplax serrata]|uniref:Uncharacterized protein n=1 Tax=Polyplax serrata TaxID=468196 RepID=A0ABR1AVM9_POLSC
MVLCCRTVRITTFGDKLKTSKDHLGAYHHRNLQFVSGVEDNETTTCSRGFFNLMIFMMEHDYPHLMCNLKRLQASALGAKIKNTGVSF